ncbi:MAG: A24 family peptidase [Pseudomonadota bacterium]|nr:A24 family peptidase [Pseudomonadota bacterium]
MLDDFGLFYAQYPVIFGLVTFVFGTLVGSFLNVVILRLPLILEQTWQEEAALILGKAPKATARVTLWGPRSACPSCSSTIRAYDNIPVVSFLLLRGRCRDCSTRIALRYPLIELMTGFVTLGLLIALGWNTTFAAALVLSYGLIALTFIDFDHQILPDQITLPGIWIGLLLNLNGIFCSLEESVIGAMAGYLSLWIVYQGFKLATGKEGMGFGDFKLLAALGAWFGWTALPGIVLISSAIGAIIGITLIALGRPREEAIAFGPYLALAGFIYLLAGDTVMSFYLPAGAL